MDYPKLSKRIKAFGLDYLLIAGYIVFLVSIGLSIRYFWLKDNLNWSRIIWELITFLTTIVPVIFYFSFYESSKKATWGKQKVGIEVVNQDGSGISFPQAILRSIVKFIPWQIAHTVIFQAQTEATKQPTSNIAFWGFGAVYLLVIAYYLSAVISRDNRSVYDFVAGTYVVEKAADGVVD